jgi:hypothetical protein
MKEAAFHGRKLKSIKILATCLNMRISNAIINKYNHKSFITLVQEIGSL